MKRKTSLDLVVELVVAIFIIAIAVYGLSSLLPYLKPLTAVVNASNATSSYQAAPGDGGSASTTEDAR